jgi:hypothetical protein
MEYRNDRSFLEESAEPTQKSPVETSLSVLHLSIDELSTLISVLEKKTSSVRIQRPLPGALNEEMADEERCSLIEEIDRAKAKVITVMRRLTEIIDEIQL